MKRDSAQPSALQPIRVLLVDDSPAFLATLRGFLVRRSAVTVVAAAGDGHAAVEQLVKHRPDLVIMDVGMPRMNGLEAAVEMRRLAPEVRIILVSIHQDAQTQADSLKHGADRFVPKIGIQRRLWPEIERCFPHLKSGQESRPHERAQAEPGAHQPLQALCGQGSFSHQPVLS